MNLFGFRKQTMETVHRTADHEFLPSMLSKLNGLLINQFSERCSSCWNSDDFGFATIDMTRKPNDGKYRNKINDFLNVATL